MGTDGLWDVTMNEKAADVVQKSLDHFPANDAQRYKYRYKKILIEFKFF